MPTIRLLYTILSALFALLALLVPTLVLACPLMTEASYPPELQSMIDQENEVRPDVDAVVWGAFVRPKTVTSENQQTLKFYVGGRLKGDVPDNISILTDNQNNLSFATIYYLNLRKTADGQWTDIAVPQDRMNWNEEACRVAPTGQRCKLYQLQQSEGRKHCLAYIQKTHSYSGCLVSKALPKTCLPVREEYLRRRR